MIAVTDNVVMMKVYKNFPEMVDVLTEHNLTDKAVMISRCGLPDEVIIHDLEAAKEQKVNYLSTILARRR